MTRSWAAPATISSTAGPGNNTIEGGTGNATISGGGGDDVLSAGGGDDSWLMYYSSQNMTLTNDTFSTSGGGYPASVSTINGFEERNPRGRPR